MTSFDPAKTGFSRVFLIDGRARPDHEPNYESCAKAMGIDWSLGDIERIECPDPNKYGEFVEVGEVQGADSRPTTSLVSRYAADLRSAFLKIAKKRCDVDAQVHFGACQNPSAFNDFSKALVYEKARGTNFGTEDLGALGSDENAKVDETLDISMREFYEFMPLSYASKAGDVITNEVVDTVLCDNAACGDCEDESDGCQSVFSITLAAGGSPGTPPDVVFTRDGGVTFLAHDIDTLGAAENPDGVDCLDGNILVVSNDSGSLHYAPIVDFTAATDPAFTEMAVGFVVAGAPNDIDVAAGGTVAFIVGNGGYVYSSTDPTASVTVLDAGVAVQDNLNRVYALSDTFAVAVGNAGSIVFTQNGTTWAIAPSTPVGVGINLFAIYAKNEKEWFIGGSNGILYYTLDQGVTWTAKAFPGSGAGNIRDIQAPTDSVIFMAHDTATPLGRILESIDGGQSWIVAPRGVGALAANDRINALAVCPDDPNFVVGVGLADDAADGFIVLGED